MVYIPLPLNYYRKWNLLKISSVLPSTNWGGWGGVGDGVQIYIFPPSSHLGHDVGI